MDVDSLMLGYEPPKEKAQKDFNQATLKRVEPDDPTRCQAVHANLQCPFQAVDGAKMCARHAGNANKLEKGTSPAQIRSYMVERWQRHLDRHNSNPKIKNLREDLGVLRMTFEVMLNRYQDETELEMRSGKIIEMVREIAKTAQICQKLERENGELLDKTQAVAFLQQILVAIAEELSNTPDAPELLRRISERFIAATDSVFPQSH